MTDDKFPKITMSWILLERQKEVNPEKTETRGSRNQFAYETHNGKIKENGVYAFFLR